MIRVSNQTELLYFMQLNDGPRHYLDSQTTVIVKDWKPNNNVKIGYINGRNEPMLMINNQQVIPGTFTIAMNRAQPKITFEIDKDALATDWNEWQLQCVARVFQCECAKNDCPCMQPSSYRANCQHLIRDGILTDAQLDGILDELFG